MSYATATNPALKDILSDVIGDFDVRGAKFDPLGLVSGFKAYRVYCALSGMSDKQLRDLGIARKDIPRVAMESIAA